MDLIKAQLARVQQQLAGLTASQKMLTLTLVAVMVGTLVWWAKYAGEPAMEPLLNQTMSKDDLANIKNGLDLRGITSAVQGDKIYVPAEQKWDALGYLGEQRMLPADTKTGFDEMIANMSPWDSPTKTAKMFAEAKQRTLARVIGQFSGVVSATVFIDTPDHRSFVNQSTPTATINIVTRHGDRAPGKLAIAAADLVCGAQAGLKRRNVAVIIDSNAIPLPDQEDNGYAGSSEFIESRRDAEKYFEDKVRGQLTFIPQLMTTVNVELDIKSSSQQTHTPNAQNTVSKVLSESNQSTEVAAPAQPQGEAGAVPNAGLSLNSGSGGSGAGGNTTSNDKTEYKLDIGTTDTVTRTPAGYFHATNATVRVPRSYFVGVYKARNPGAKDPDEVALQPVITAELEQIRNDVKMCTGLAQDDAVVVQPYTDVTPVYPAFAAAAAAAADDAKAGGATAMVTGHAKEIALGVLAVASLFMVSMMVKRSAPAPLVMPEVEKKEPETFGGEDVAGEAGSGEALLDGMELDDDSVRTQHMLEQVSTMVKENPDAAATLVKRWLNRT